MKTLLMCYQAATEVIDENNPAYNAGYNYEKPRYFLTPEENLEPPQGNDKLQTLAELPEMDSWQIQKVNAVLKEI